MKTYPRSLIMVLLTCATGCADFAREEQDFCTRNPERCEGPCVPTSMDDQPDDAFEDTNCDGIDGMADAGVFVDPLNGSDEDKGTAAEPLKTLGEALERIRAGTAPRLVYLAQGPYNEPELTLDTEVALYGAYGGRNNWTRRNEYITHLDGGTVGLVIRGISEDAGVVLDRLTITSANATAAGEPSVALHVINSNGVRLRYDTFAAGQGAPGTPGSPGAQGSDGGMGGPGGNAEGATKAGASGEPGLSNCNNVSSSGGAGQMGSPGYFSGLAGFEGMPSPLGGAGGPGGDAGTPSSADPIICRAGNGRDGSTGQPGTNGSAGSRGEGVGAVNDLIWVATQQGGSGDAGPPGGGGGGGGSGGGCPQIDSPSTIPGAAGGGSGGGGGGGCGGDGGSGGGGGGASIAVLLIRSNVVVEGNTVLRTRGGGQGGAGGEGGRGGTGGKGGPGGDGGTHSDPEFKYISYGGHGGAGGQGGAGGPGGPGGGGGGGPSVGVWCSDGGVLTTEGVTLTESLGPAGDGGSSPGNAGAGGQVIRFHSCDPSPP